MRLFTIILIFISTHCHSQQSYEQLFLLRLDEIKNLTYYNNNVVIYKYGIGRFSFDKWDRNRVFYIDEMVVGDDGQVYHALKDSKGKTPSNSPNEWQLSSFEHPYFFLRDTARTEDLSKLLLSDNPYVKTYAFGALTKRKFPGLYEVMLDNLSDTTQISQLTEDYGYDVCPADLMILYILYDMTKRQRKNLLALIKTDYPHLEDAIRTLSEL